MRKWFDVRIYIISKMIKQKKIFFRENSHPSVFSLLTLKCKYHMRERRKKLCSIITNCCNKTIAYSRKIHVIQFLVLSFFLMMYFYNFKREQRNWYDITFENLKKFSFLKFFKIFLLFLFNLKYMVLQQTFCYQIF